MDFFYIKNISFISRNWIEFLISKFDFYKKKKKKTILSYHEIGLNFWYQNWIFITNI